MIMIDDDSHYNRNADWHEMPGILAWLESSSGRRKNTRNEIRRAKSSSSSLAASAAFFDQVHSGGDI